MTVSDPYEGCVAVFEVKCAHAIEEMDRECKKALHQIQEKMYAKEYQENYDRICCYGIAFYKKRCLVKKEM